MLSSQPLDLLPYWAVFVLTIVLLFLSEAVGCRLGHFIQKRWPDHFESGVGAMVGAALALLGFLLAVTSSIAMGVFNDRRLLVITEANAIGTTYLRAGYLPEPYGEESRQLLRQYVDARLLALEPGQLEAAILRSEQIHSELWSRAVAVARENSGPTIALYLSALNEVIDLHTERVEAELGFRVLPDILLGLYGVAMLTLMLVGVYDSYKEKRNLVALIILVLILTVVFMLIVDMDRSQQGFIRISHNALINLRRGLSGME
jgi:hypothetical protein